MKTPSKETQNVFDLWVNRSTWDTGHWADDQRFYDFVKSAYQDGMDSGTLTELLNTKIDQRYADWAEQRATKSVSRAIVRFEEIVGFLKHTKITA